MPDSTLLNKDSEFWPRAVLTLGDLGNTSEEVTNALLDMLKNKDSEVSSIASFTLRRLGKIHVQIIDSIVQWIEQHQSSEYVDNGIDILWNLVAEEAN